MVGCPCCGQRARGGRPARGDPEPGRARAERLARCQPRRASAYRPGAQRRKARAQPGQAARREDPGPGRGRGPGLDRPLAARSWPRFLRSRGTALVVSRQLIANPRFNPFAINFPLRSGTGASLTRNDSGRSLRMRKPGGPAPPGLATRAASLLTGGPLGGRQPAVAAAARARAAAPGDRTGPAAENPNHEPLSPI